MRGVRSVASVTASDFVNGATVKWGALASTVFGGLYLGIMTGWIEVVLAVFGAATGLLDGFASWLATVAAVVFGTPGAVVSGSYRQLLEAAGTAGVAAWLATLVGLVALMYVLELGVSRVA